MTDLLRIEHLDVSYRVHGGSYQAVEDVSFTIPHSGALALVGESGSGKTSIANAVLRLLPHGAAKVRGSVNFDGQSILGLSERRFRKLRVGGIGYIPQDPTNSLNPVRRIGPQVIETLRLDPTWRTRPRSVQHDEAVRLLNAVGLPNAKQTLELYPHQLSGGMLQRVLIAIAIALKPRLIIADEPTSALDVTVQQVIFDLINQLRADLGISLLIITHDLAVARNLTDHTVILRNGTVIESDTSASIFAAPREKYTAALVSNVPGLSPDKYAAAKKSRPTPAGAKPMIVVNNLVKTFDRDGRQTTAIGGVSLTVLGGRTHALVGESGSGKTTVARTIMRLETPTAGSVEIDGVDIAALTGTDLRAYRKRVQLVYQNPYRSLDPRLRVADIIAEPLKRFKVGDRTSRRDRVSELLSDVGLHADLTTAPVRQLSGGQRQRVAIARALALQPDVIVLDEATSALDVTVQGQILDVLVRLQAELDLTYLVISHDFGVVRQIADDVTVMRGGLIVESGQTEQIFADPTTNYARQLISAVPGFS